MAPVKFEALWPLRGRGRRCGRPSDGRHRSAAAHLQRVRPARDVGGRGARGLQPPARRCA
eukprot:scaffold7971_cov39-Phaeocystis_antarctica.AAC.1